MFRYNPKANYQPNGGQILSGKDLYKQTIVVNAGTHDGVAQQPSGPEGPYLPCKISEYFC